ncbi:hypothetical protein [Novipirellula sp.]
MGSDWRFDFSGTYRTRWPVIDSDGGADRSGLIASPDIEGV